MAQNEVSIKLTVEERQALKALTALTRKTEQFSDTAVKEVKKADNAFKDIAKTATGFLAANAIGKASGFIVNGFKDGIASAISFEKSIVEINTILPKNTKLTEAQVEQLDELSKKYGTTAQEQAKSYYQIISAGVTDATQASELLAAANELAIGGLTDTSSAINILTSTVNAYGSENINSRQAADSLFTAVRLGKTTVDELASSLALAIPAAKSAGVSFDEVNAAVATLTTRGFETSTAVTRVNGLLTALARNGEKLGSGFDLTAVKTDGLVNVIRRLQERTKGSGDELIKLLGRQEAVQAVQTLGAEGASAYAEALGQFADKAGAASDAFSKFKNTADFQFKQLQSNIDSINRSIADAFIPTMNFAAKALNEFLNPREVTAISAVNQEITKQRKAVERLKSELEDIKKIPEGDPLSTLFFGSTQSQVDNAIAKLDMAEKKLKQLRDTKKALIKDSPTGGATQDIEDASNSLEVVAEKEISQELLKERQNRFIALEKLRLEQKAKEQEVKLQDQELSTEERTIALKKLQQFEQQKATIQLAENLKKNESIKDANAKALADEAARVKQSIAIQQSQAKAEQAINQARVRNREMMVAGFGRALQQASALAKQGTAEQKALATSAAIINTYQAGTRAYKDYPYPANLAVLATTIATGLNQVSQIQRQSFQTGGVVGGFNGATNGTDNTTVNARSGELILNANQQRRLFDIADGRDSQPQQARNLELTTVVQIDEREIARSVRNQKLEGFSV